MSESGAPGLLFALVTLPPSSSAQHTDAMLERARAHIQKTEGERVRKMFTATSSASAGWAKTSA